MEVSERGGLGLGENGWWLREEFVATLTRSFHRNSAELALVKQNLNGDMSFLTSTLT